MESKLAQKENENKNRLQDRKNVDQHIRFLWIENLGIEEKMD